MFGRNIKVWSKREQKTMGVIGVSRGIGTTFCMMMMAYFAKQVLKEKTAVVEKNFSGHLQKLCEENETLCIKGIDIFRENISYEQNRYSRLFFDFGTCIHQKKSNFSEFSLCTEKIIIASLCSWRYRELFQFVEECSEISGNEKWIYLIPFASQKAVEQAERHIHRKVYAVAAEKEWYCMSMENLALWNKILR